MYWLIDCCIIHSFIHSSLVGYSSCVTVLAFLQQQSPSLLLLLLLLLRNTIMVLDHSGMFVPYDNIPLSMGHSPISHPKSKSSTGITMSRVWDIHPSVVPSSTNWRSNARIPRVPRRFVPTRTIPQRPEWYNDRAMSIWFRCNTAMFEPPSQYSTGYERDWSIHPVTYKSWRIGVPVEGTGHCSYTKWSPDDVPKRCNLPSWFDPPHCLLGTGYSGRRHRSYTRYRTAIMHRRYLSTTFAILPPCVAMDCSCCSSSWLLLLSRTIVVILENKQTGTGPIVPNERWRQPTRPHFW